MRAETRTCHNYWCNYETEETVDKCPKCGRAMLDRAAYRVLGVVLSLCGLFLSATGGGLLVFVAPKLVRGGLTVKILVWSIFTVLLLVGLSILSAGVIQIVTGRRNQSLMTIVVALVATLMIVGGVVQSVLG